MRDSIWSWERGKIKVFVDSPVLIKRIGSWAKAKAHCHYFFPDGRHAVDFIMPAYLHDKVAGILGLPKKSKSVNRINNGKKLAVARGLV